MKKITIYSKGSCDQMSREGSYSIRMEYNETSKFFTGDLKDTTANRCIIQGCIVGIQKLKEPCQVEFITATNIGVANLEKGKGVNKDLLQELKQLLVEKNCNYHFTIKEGDADWLKAKINGN